MRVPSRGSAPLFHLLSTVSFLSGLFMNGVDGQPLRHGRLSCTVGARSIWAIAVEATRRRLWRLLHRRRRRLARGRAGSLTRSSSALALPGCISCTGCGSWGSRCGCMRAAREWAAPDIGTATPARVSIPRVTATGIRSPKNFRRWPDRPTIRIASGRPISAILQSSVSPRRWRLTPFCCILIRGLSERIF